MFGDSARQVATDVAIDPTGDAFVLVVGTFEGTLEFSQSIPALESKGQRDVFVAKFKLLDSEVVWFRQFGGVGDDNAAGLAVDGGGNVVVAGDFTDVLQLDADTDITAVDRDGFVVRLNSDGIVDAARTVQLTGQGDQSVASMALDPMGRVILTGSFAGTIDYGPATATSLGPEADAYVVALAPEGTVEWHAEFGDVDSLYGQYGRAVAANSQVVAVAINGRGTVENEPGSTTDDDAFVVFLNASGFVTNTALLNGAAGVQHANALALDSKNNVWVVGTFTERVKAPGMGELTAEDDIDGYFMKLVPGSGTAELGGVLGGEFVDIPLDVVVDAVDEVTIVGSFQSSLILPQNPEMPLSTAGTLQARGDFDLFVVKLAQNGVHLWGEAFGGSLIDQALAVAIDRTEGLGRYNHLFVVGSFEDDFDFGGTELIAEGDSDLFVARLSP
jgi:hypothetical protein